MTLRVPVYQAFPDLGYPLYALPGSSGMDLKAAIETPMVLSPLQRCLVPTGLKMAIPQGYEGQIRSRSGLALNHGLVVLNSPGTLDASYRGEIKVLIINMSDIPFEVSRGLRIAQLVIAPVVMVTLSPDDAFSFSQRQDSGFGSTGLY